MHNEPIFTYHSNQEVLDAAIDIIQERFKRKAIFTNVDDTKIFLACKMANYSREVFSVLLLDSQHQLLEYKELFFGTIDSASVYPREIAKAALESNAVAVILAHNHPSGVAEPSQADIAITEKIQRALNLVDIRTLDHIIVGKSQTSLAERGYL